MASDEIVVLYSEEEEEGFDETACKYALGQRKASREEKPKYIWTEEKIRTLIKVWSKTPILYDTKDSLYFNKVEREKAISNIATKLGITVIDVLGKMYSLRTYYSKQQGMIKASINKGTEDVYKPRWQWYESLSFLSDHMRMKLNNVCPGSVRSDPIKDPLVVNTAVPERTDSPEIQELEISVNPTTKKARLSIDGDTTDETVHSTKQQTQHDAQASDDMLWAEQMGRSIQKIEDEELKEWLKLEIQQMIIRTRFKKPRGSFNTEFNSVSS
ncbi:uncharacterized protein LOC116292772 [Actinia tenebrosa]|uniref:Uncharacterized protein LOC116292772 n=1 Tax=Actinia tenebrosa TaxID=6105 RepID=A0A6P8HLY5_ACTTE|nr:uncharacterized protein LOC116292772 [Actinia tenebrosa]